MSSSSTKAPRKPSAGDASAGNTTLCVMSCHSTPRDPDWTSAAPISPPISACDELEGRPNHHVSRFQAMAPITAASTVCSVASPVSMIPFPPVFAPAVVTKAPARFATAATRTAMRGESARVDTDVATAFAVSWKPFVKSKPSEATTTTTRRTSPPTPLAVLHDDRLEDVRGVLARVDGLLELLVDVLPADDRDRVLLGAEELGDGATVEVVALVLEGAELDQLVARVADPLEPLDRLLELRRGAQDHVRLSLGRRPHLGDAVPDHV